MEVGCVAEPRGRIADAPHSGTLSTKPNQIKEEVKDAVPSEQKGMYARPCCFKTRFFGGPFWCIIAARKLKLREIKKH